VCQFVELGWQYLATGYGSGMLSNATGGSYTTLVSPDRKHYTVVIEKLEGQSYRTPTHPPLPATP